MGTFREPNPLADLFTAQQTRVLECLKQYANGEGAARISEARRLLRALAEAEANVLYPAFSRVNLPLETQRLLEDSRDNRAQQLEGLDVLAHKRGPRLRKLAAVELCDRVEHHGMQHVSQLIPVLFSQLPRPVYQSVVRVFKARFEAAIEQAAPAREPRRARAMASNA